MSWGTVMMASRCSLARKGNAHECKHGEPESLMRSLIETACARRIVLNSLRIAVVVGTILNLINQSGAILAWPRLSLISFLPNFAGPLCVARYSAAKNELAQRGGK